MKSTDLNVHLSPDRCYLAPIFSNISPLFLDTGNNFSLRYCDSVPNNHQGNWRNRLLAGEMSRHARQDTTQPWFDVYLTILPHFHRGQSLNLVFLSSLRPYLASFGKFYVGDNFLISVLLLVNGTNRTAGSEGWVKKKQTSLSIRSALRSPHLWSRHQIAL